MLRNLTDNRDEQGTGIGLALLRYRIAARLNQADIARSLGVSQSQVSRWESGREMPRAGNLTALKSLVWGREDPVLAALSFGVREANSPLVLVDEDLRIVAASRFLRHAGGPLLHFASLFDPQGNGMLARFAAEIGVMAREGADAVRIEMPFEHEGRPWLCEARLTLCPIGPRLFGLGETSFARRRGQSQQTGRVWPIRRSAAAAVRGSGGN